MPLARFCRLEGWRDLVSRTDAVPETSTPQTPASAISGRRRMRIRPGHRHRTAIIGLLSLFGSRLKQKPAGKDADVPGLRFDARQATDDLPNSVVFHYDADSLHPGKLRSNILDTTRREEVAPDGKEHTSLYIIPAILLPPDRGWTKP